jgi:hypothetical protein
VEWVKGHGNAKNGNHPNKDQNVGHNQKIGWVSYGYIPLKPVASSPHIIITFKTSFVTWYSTLAKKTSGGYGQMLYLKIAKQTFSLMVS